MKSEITDRPNELIDIELFEYWVDNLDAPTQEGFNSFAKNPDSVIEIYVYARFLGYKGSIVACELWVKDNYPKVDYGKKLQAKFQKYNVLNLAQTGYGITHAAIQYKTMTDILTQNDVVVLPYVDYYLPRNYGAPSWIRTLSSGLETSISGRVRLSKAMYPVARTTKNSGLSIEYLHMSCEYDELIASSRTPRSQSWSKRRNLSCSSFPKSKPR